MTYWQHKEHPVEYNAWNAMRVRCRNPSHPCYNRYGGRGIGVCEEWSTFAAFFADMGPRPSPAHSLDRRDNDSGYSAGNCYWATKEEQTRNRTNTRRLTYEGETLTLLEWSRRTGLSYTVIYSRWKRGWPVNDILTRPPDKTQRIAA